MNQLTPLFSALSGLCSTFDNSDFKNCNLDLKFRVGSPSVDDTKLCYGLGDAFDYRNTDFIKLLVIQSADTAIINCLVWLISPLPLGIMCSLPPRYRHTYIHLTATAR